MKSGLPSAASAIRALVASGVADHELAFRRRERLEQDRRRVHLATAPRGPLLEQLRTREAEQQHRRVPRRLDEVVEEVEQRRLGPVDVFEHDDQRPLTRENPEELAHGPEELGRRPSRLRRADRAGDAVGDLLRIGLALEQCGDRIRRRAARGIADELRERPERDSRAV
jgi:hypothetical protein